MSARPTGASDRSLGTLLRHSVVYSLVPVLQRVLSFLLTGVFTAVLNPAQWGVQGLTDVLISATTQIGGQNLLAGMTRFYFDHEEPAKRNAVITTAILALGAFSLVIVLLAWVFIEPLTALLFDVHDPLLAGDDLDRCLAIALFTIPFAMASEAAFRWLQVQKLSGTYTWLRSIKFVVELGLKLVFVCALGWGVEGFLAAVLCGEVLTSILLTGSLLARLKPRFSWELLRPMLVYAGPLIPVGAMQMGLHQSGRVLLRVLGPERELMTWVGIYSLGFQVGFMVQSLGMGSFMQIWQPSLFAVQDPGERARFQARVNTWAALGVALIATVMLCFDAEIVRLLSGDGEHRTEYFEARKVLPWIAAAYVFYGFYALGQATLLAEKRTGPLVWINALALALNLALGVVLIPRFGGVGAGVALLATFVVQALVMLRVAHGPGRAPIEGARLARVALGVLAALAAAWWLDARPAVIPELTLGNLSLKLGVLVAILGFFALGVLTGDERRAIRARLARLPLLGRLLG